MTLVSAAVAAAALCLPVSIAGTNAALALLTAALLLRARRPEDRSAMAAAWRSEPLISALAAYAAAGLLCGLLGADPARSLRETPKDLHRLWAAALFLAAFAVDDCGRLRPSLAASFCVSALWGIAQVAHHSAFVRLAHHPLERSHGSLHPVAYGETMVIAALGALCFLMRSRPPRAHAAAAAAVLAATGAALALNETRSAIFALLAGLLVIAWLDPSTRRRAGAAAVAAAAIILAWEFLPTGGRSLLDLFRKLEATNPNQARYTLWSVAWAMFRDHPLTGAGPGNYLSLFTRYFEGTLDNQRAWASAHNLYLHQLAERGLIGAAALGAVFWTMGRRAWSAAREVPAPETAWAAAAVAAFLVMNATEIAFQNELVSTLLLFVWSAGASAGRRKIL